MMENPDDLMVGWWKRWYEAGKLERLKLCEELPLIKDGDCPKEILREDWLRVQAKILNSYFEDLMSFQVRKAMNDEM